MVDRHKLTVFYLKSFDMDSVQVGKAVFGKEIHTTLGIEPRTNSNPGRYGNPYSVCWFKKPCGHSPLNPSKVGHEKRRSREEACSLLEASLGFEADSSLPSISASLLFRSVFRPDMSR